MPVFPSTLKFEIGLSSSLHDVEEKMSTHPHPLLPRGARTSETAVTLIGLKDRIKEAFKIAISG
jgi:hypothetical protein